MSLKMIGKKKEMTQIFDKEGNVVVCTIIEAMPNFITQVKTKEKDGYNAVQIGGLAVSDKRVSKPQQGHYAKSSSGPFRRSIEARIDEKESFQLGEKIDVSYFSEGSLVAVKGVSKGKGYQGVMKLHNFAGGPASHGSGFHRHAGSTGMRSSPGRCFPGGKRAGHMGQDKVTVENLKVIAVMPEKNLLLVKGAVPGSRGSIVTIQKARNIS